MIALLLALGVGRANDLPPKPTAPATVSGQCLQTLAISQGSPIPPALLGDVGLARCSGVVVPLSDYAHLLKIEAHADLVRDLHAIDTEQLRSDRDHWQEVAEAATADVWHRSPWFVVVTTSALVTACFVTYDRINGRSNL